MQKTIFLSGEGDQWFARNSTTVTSNYHPERDPLLLEAALAQAFEGKTTKVLEIGCGLGLRLSHINKAWGCEVYGLDPSSKSVENACKLGVNASVGTADSLPYNSGQFDVVIYGFCLYLIDREDLFRAVAEADRVLKNPGWLLIKDFYSRTPVSKPYHHKEGVHSFKMDYSTLFSWHPFYTIYSHRLIHHADEKVTDDPAEWVSITLLRKCET